MNPLQERKYSLKWASDIVSQLWNKHARATNLIHQMYGVSARKAAWLLANSARRWSNYKQAVHMASKWYKTLENNPEGPQEFSPQVIHSFDFMLRRMNLIK